MEEGSVKRSENEEGRREKTEEGREGRRREHGDKAALSAAATGHSQARGVQSNRCGRVSRAVPRSCLAPSAP